VWPGEYVTEELGYVALACVSSSGGVTESRLLIVALYGLHTRAIS